MKQSASSSLHFFSAAFLLTFSPSLRAGTPPVSIPDIAGETAAAKAQDPRGSESNSPGQSMMKSQAEQVYFNLLHEPRFGDSKVIQSWITEFLSYPDLAAINHRYHQQGDPLRFLSDTTRSENFQKMLDKYIGTPDVQAFMAAMAGSPTVAASANQYLADDDLRRMAQKLGFAGGTSQAGTRSPKNAQ